LPHADTVFAQLLKLVPRHEFDRLAKSRHSGGRLRRMTRWSQFTSMVTGHVAPGTPCRAKALLAT